MVEKIIYRVVIKVGYYEAFFDFDSVNEACEFTRTAVVHSVENEDSKRPTSLTIKVINPEQEREDDE